MRLRLLCIAVFLPFLLDLSLLGAEEKQWKEVDWGKVFGNEERIFEIIESPEYSPEDRSMALDFLSALRGGPSLNTVKRLMNLPADSWTIAQFKVLIKVPYLLEQLGPISRQEGVRAYRDYCYRILEGSDESQSYWAAWELAEIGDFVPIIDFGNTYGQKGHKHYLDTLYYGSCGRKNSPPPARMPTEEEIKAFNAQARVEYGAFLDTLMYAVCGLDWKAKLAPDAKVQSAIDKNVELLGSEDPEERKDAREALLKTGTPAHPAIAKAKDNPDVEVRSACEWLLEQYPLTIPARAIGYVEKFRLDRDALLLAALLDVKDDALHKAAHERLKKITGADLSDKREEWKKWHSENAPYAEWCEKQGKYGIVKHAKESKAPLSRWKLIPEEQRKKWDKLEEPDRKRLIEEAEKAYQKALEDEEKAAKNLPRKSGKEIE